MSIAVSTQDVSKEYRSSGLRETRITEAIGRRIGRRAPLRRHRAVDGVTLDVSQGSILGIIGNNGAGKSTLLRLLSGITRPTSGVIHVNGRPAPLLDIGTGFHTELTGRENVYFGGSLLGLTRNEVNSRFDEIVEFAGIGSYLDVPVKHYSSGMFVRLGFSVLAHSEPDVLLVDEVLAVGDAQFQALCLDRVRRLTNDGAAVIWVTHDLERVQRVADRLALMAAGRITSIGSPSEVLETYRSDGEVQRPVFLEGVRSIHPSSAISIESVKAAYRSGRNSVTAGEATDIVVAISSFEELPSDLNIGIWVHNERGGLVLGTNTAMLGVNPHGQRASQGLRVRFSIASWPLPGGTYFVSAAVEGRDGESYAQETLAATIQSLAGSPTIGSAGWSLEAKVEESV